MGFFGKIFGKKKEKEEDLEINEETSPSSDYPGPVYPRAQQPIMPAYPESDDKEFQVLSSKLDTLNIKLDMINQRLANLEKLAEQEPEKKW